MLRYTKDLGLAEEVADHVLMSGEFFAINGDCFFVLSCPDPNNHVETVLVTIPFGQWLRHIPS